MLVRQNLHTHYREAAASTKDGEVKECEKCATVLPSRVFAVMNGQATVGILPVTLFAGGHHYFVARLPQTQGVTPYIVHATFQVGGDPCSSLAHACPHTCARANHVRGCHSLLLSTCSTTVQRTETQPTGQPDHNQTNTG